MENFKDLSWLLCLSTLLILVYSMPYFLSFLILLEIGSMGLSIFLLLNLKTNEDLSFTFLLMLVLLICEGVLGLGVLIKASRVSSKDTVFMKTLMKI